jgi:hypothetical protein
VGLSVQDLERGIRRRLPDEGVDFKRLRGYRTDRKPMQISRRLVVAVAEVCGASVDEGLLLFDQALTAAERHRKLDAHVLPMCGRHDEFALCRRLVDEAFTGRRLRTVLVLGGAGFGKTLMAQSLEVDLLEPPRAEVVRIAAGAGLDELEAKLVGQRSSAAIRSGPGPDDFAEELFRRTDGIRDALVARALRCATVVVIDDVHHASRPLVDLVTQLADQDVGASLAIVATSRPDPRVDGLSHARTTTVVELGPLDRDGLTEMVGHRGPSLRPADRAALAAAVFDSTEGHPAGAAMVLADHLDGEGWRPGSDLAGARESAVQTTLERWRRRVSALPARTRAVLTAGAVVGISFDIRLLRPLPWLGDVGDRVAESLEPAIHAGVVRWLDGGSSGGGTVYEFSHELGRDAVLALVRPPVRTEINHQVAGALASPLGALTHRDPAIRNAELFWHRRYALPGYPEEALPLARVALLHGQSRIAALDDPGARDALDSGLAALGELPPHAHPDIEAGLLRWLSLCPSVGTDGRRRALTEALNVLLATPEADPDLLVDITCDYSHLPGFSSRYDPDARDKCRQVLAFITAYGADSRLMARLEATIAFHELWCIQDDAGEALDRARQLSSSAWAHAVESGDPVAQIAALDAAGLLLYLSPDARAMVDLGRRMRHLGARMSVYEPLGLVRQGRRAEFERALDLATSAEGFPWPEGWTHRALLLQFRSLEAFLDGDLEEALARTKEMVDRYHERDPNFSQVFAAAFLWATYQAVGAEPARAMALAAAEEQPDIPGYRVAAAFFWARSGDHDAALAMLDDLIGAGLGALRQDASWTLLLALLAETIALTGAARHAQAAYDALVPYRGQAIVVATGVFCYGAVDRFLAMLAPLLDGGGMDAATAFFESALAVERRLEAPALTARTLFWFSRTLASQGGADNLVWAAELLADAAAECPPQLRELQEWIAHDRSALPSRPRRPLNRPG